MDSLDLSDVLDLEDHFLTTSDEEELPGLEEGLEERTLIELWYHLNILLY